VEPLALLGPLPEPGLLRDGLALYPAVRRGDEPGHRVRGLLLAAGDHPPPPPGVQRREIEDILGQYIGPLEARETVSVFLRRHRLERRA